MATTITKLNNGIYPITTLDTYSYTILTTAIHQVAVKLHNRNVASSVTITLKKNGSTIASLNTSPTLATEANCIVLTSCTANDIISAEIASAAAADASLNVISGYLRINITNVPD